ncbi:hypothetical protein [Salinisphaera sp. G21_0]|uniref:hypothetical protein n=1 Tax=Salinisphaera sp. G21_0 TaxID=2821094 RepID=UPI001ADAE4AC|nr:hypothetical protein [Salinisphaera sp. G21_0]MBO9483254.1 hypothetical protein [Salinisphaera sp. G21_0]
MTGPTAGNPALNSPQNAQNSEWTCVSWFKKISDAVASKTSRFFGRVVAAVVTVATFIPSLGVDLVYAAKSLYDRKVTNLQAKVEWIRDIHDGDVKTTMGKHNRFLANNVLHHPEAIPEAAHQQLVKALNGDIPVELITPDQNAFTTFKFGEELRIGESRRYYDIGDGQALAMNNCPHQFYDELMMNRYLEKLGVPTIEIKPAVIRWEFEGEKYTMATYITTSFSEYAKQNAFLMHKRSTSEETELLDGKKLLAVDEDEDKYILTPEHWDEVLKPLVNDVRTLIDNGVSTHACYGISATHKAIVVGKGNKFHSGGPADYEIRAFPYEFVDETTQLDQLPPKKRLTAKEEKEILRHYIELAAFVQFNPKAWRLPKEWKKLVKDLVERHIRR